ncbi:MAG: low molecular weight phosphotyrosine protein phosphatase [Flavobacteriales bacterium]|nr:low molecular weight phosphotyrosine protein phosphatase [Flavobacteriales bacterium]MBP9079908.1 low molecular weight phosphotyrosine protein phosphatase [Flavobacteriales bacterium]
MAEGLLRHMARERGLEVYTDSAGTGRSHLGQAPDPRAQAEMLKHRLDISDLRARLFHGSDYERFDLLLAMDGTNLADMLRLAPNPDLAAKARLILDWSSTHPGGDVPDPWYGGPEGFEYVHALLEEAIGTLLNDLRDEA